jgi:hypothetical protein
LRCLPRTRRGPALRLLPLPQDRSVVSGSASSRPGSTLASEVLRGSDTLLGF